MTAYIVRDGDAKLTDVEMKNYLNRKICCLSSYVKNLLPLFIWRRCPFYSFPSSMLNKISFHAEV